MFENIANFFKKLMKSEKKDSGSKDAAKERLHLVLMQDRANVSADFLELMKQEIIEVIKKYIEVDEKEIDVRLTNKANEDGTNGAPALYANIPILNIKNEMKKEVMAEKEEQLDEKQTISENQDKESLTQTEDIKEGNKNEEIIENENIVDSENTEIKEDIETTENDEILENLENEGTVVVQNSQINNNTQTF